VKYQDDLALARDRATSILAMIAAG
jgi:hypothetical protein